MTCSRLASHLSRLSKLCFCNLEVVGLGSESNGDQIFLYLPMWFPIFFPNAHREITGLFSSALNYLRVNSLLSIYFLHNEKKKLHCLGPILWKYWTDNKAFCFTLASVSYWPISYQCCLFCTLCRLLNVKTKKKALKSTTRESFTRSPVISQKLHSPEKHGLK